MNKDKIFIFCYTVLLNDLLTYGCPLQQYRLLSFQAGYTKLERFLLKNQHTQKELSNLENSSNGEESKSAKIWHSKSIFYIKNHLNLSIFFSLKNLNLGEHFFLSALIFSQKPFKIFIPPLKFLQLVLP